MIKLRYPQLSDKTFSVTVFGQSAGTRIQKASAIGIAGWPDEFVAAFCNRILSDTPCYNSRYAAGIIASFAERNWRRTTITSCGSTFSPIRRWRRPSSAELEAVDFDAVIDELLEQMKDMTTGRA